MEIPVAAMNIESGRPNGPSFLQSLPHWLAQTLPAWLPRQRWFGSKGRPIRTVLVRDAALLNNGSADETLLALVLVDVEFADSEPRESYFLPLRFAPESSGTPEPARILARVEAEAVSWLLSDGLADNGLRGELIRSLAAGRRLHQFNFQPAQNTSDLFPWLPDLAERGSSRLLQAEQSNTSMVFSDRNATPRLLLKCFRRVMPGLNPDFEITRALTEHTTFRAVPLLAGAMTWQVDGEPSDPWILGIYQAFAANQGDGWEYTVRELKACLKSGDQARLEQLQESLGLLARRTAEMHLALASVTADPAIAPEPVTAADLTQWSDEIGAQVRAAGEILETHRERLPAEWQERAAAIAAGLREAGVAAMPAVLAEGVHKVRIHGDYHLGQVLRTADDFVLFDFEGEPARPLAWRRRKWCVLKDAAGMLRSFGYAAHVAAAESTGGEASALAWEAATRQAWWNRWRATVQTGNATLLPASEADALAALRIFEMEKAVYELNYEIHHRPDWVGIPLAALERLLAAGGQMNVVG